MDIKEFKAMRIKDSGLTRYTVSKIAEYDTCGEAMTYLSEDPHFVPCMSKEDRKKMTGLLTVSDISRIDLDDPAWRSKPVSEIMTDNIVYATPENTMQELRDMMVASRHKVIPVIKDDDDYTLLGIVTSSDLREALEKRVSVTF